MNGAAKCARALGSAWHHPQAWQTASNLAIELSCEWQPCDMRMQHAWWAGADTAAAKAVAIGQQSARTMTKAVARTDWRLAPVMAS